MTVKQQVADYLAAQPERKRAEMETLHKTILRLMPKCRLWFLDGKDENGRTVSNPNIGYGFQLMKYADGSTKDFYPIGLSANTSGISVYIMGLPDKTHLTKTYAKTIGNANVTGYCIKFRSLNVINIDVLEAAIRDGIKQTSA